MIEVDARGEHRIIEPVDLHKEDGTLNVQGYAYSLLPVYKRSRVAAKKFRIKEWDNYVINDDEYAVALTMSDLGYLGMLSASVLDFKAGTCTSMSELVMLPLGKFGMPEDSLLGVAEFQNKRVRMRFEATAERRTLTCDFLKFKGEEMLHVDITLDQIPQDTMVIVTPFAEDPKAFYYNQKIDAMRAQGSFMVGSYASVQTADKDTLSISHEFSARDSFGLLDWGRGVWTYDNTWYWGMAQGWQNGKGQAGPDAPGAKRFGMNIGYGFGDTSAANENMCFIDGHAIKLGRLDFGIPKVAGQENAKYLADRFLLEEPWHVQDEEGRLDLIFTPEIDRFDLTDLKILVTDQHQVFGKFGGTLILDDGSVFQIKDLRGAGEVMHNCF